MIQPQLPLGEGVAERGSSQMFTLPEAGVLVVYASAKKNICLIIIGFIYIL